MIKPKLIKNTKQTRKPSLQLQHKPSNNLIKQSCMSDRITKQLHYSKFGWLLILRECYSKCVAKVPLSTSLTNLLDTHSINKHKIIQYIQHANHTWPNIHQLHQQLYSQNHIINKIQNYHQNQLTLDDLYNLLADQKQINTHHKRLSIDYDHQPNLNQIKTNHMKKKHIPELTISDEIIQTARFQQSRQSHKQPSSKKYNKQNQLSNNSINFDQSLTDSLYKSQADLTQKVNELMFKHTKDVEIHSLLKQLLQTQLYKDQKGQYFNAIKLTSISMSNKLNDIVHLPQIQQYLQSIKALKLTQSFLSISLLSPSLIILNISHNSIKSLPNNFNLTHLQFLNVNNNQMRNIHHLLTLQSLLELHTRNNLIDHISGGLKSYNLQLLDIGYNLVQNQYDIYGLSNLKSLKIVNIIGNPFLKTHKKIKNNSQCLIKQGILKQYQDIYIFSQYKQYKDITFGSTKDNQLILQRSTLPINSQYLTNSLVQHKTQFKKYIKQATIQNKIVRSKSECSIDQPNDSKYSKAINKPKNSK